MELKKDLSKSGMKFAHFNKHVSLANLYDLTLWLQVFSLLILQHTTEPFYLGSMGYHICGPYGPEEHQ